MPGLRQRQQPIRLPEFMAFVHARLPGPCCVCREEPWAQLHHFGDDGGRGMKPSDHLVARVCRGCAGRVEIKAHGLLRAWWQDQDLSAAELLIRFHRDAAECWRAYLEDERRTARPRGKGAKPCPNKR